MYDCLLPTVDADEEEVLLVPASSVGSRETALVCGCLDERAIEAAARPTSFELEAIFDKLSGPNQAAPGSKVY